MAHPIRRDVLELLKRGGNECGRSGRPFPVSKPTMSGHFAKLKAAGLIRGESRGGQMLYTLSLSTLEEAVMGFMGRMGIDRDPAPHGRRPGDDA